MWQLYLSIKAVEGTVNRLFEDPSGNIIGLEYKEKTTGKLTVGLHVVNFQCCFS